LEVCAGDRQSSDRRGPFDFAQGRHLKTWPDKNLRGRGRPRHTRWLSRLPVLGILPSFVSELACLWLLRKFQ
jgi:hypothetical protein